MKTYLKRLLIVLITVISTIGLLYMFNSISSIITYHNFASCEKGKLDESKCVTYDSLKKSINNKDITLLEVYKRDNVIAKGNLFDCLEILIIFVILELALHLIIKKEINKYILLPIIGILIFGSFYNYVLSPIIVALSLLFMAIIYKKCFSIKDFKKKLLTIVGLTILYSLVFYITYLIGFKLFNEQPITEAYSYTLSFGDSLLLTVILLLITIIIKLYNIKKHKDNDKNIKSKKKKK
jgi:hypothetical protein